MYMQNKIQCTHLGWNMYTKQNPPYVVQQLFLLLVWVDNMVGELELGQDGELKQSNQIIRTPRAVYMIQH